MRSFGSAVTAVLVAVTLVVAGAVVAPSFATGTDPGSGSTGPLVGQTDGQTDTSSPSAKPAATPGGTSTGDSGAAAGGSAAPRSLATTETTSTATTTPTTPTTTEPTPTTPPPPPLTVPERMKLYKPSRAGYQTYGGASFNNQYGSSSSQRRNITRVVNAINGAPGYVVPLDPATGKIYTGPGFDSMGCPTDPAYYPSEIRISVYSVAEGSFARALVRAHQRCVSVRILMNNHLTEATSASWKTIASGISRTPTCTDYEQRVKDCAAGQFRRSFAKRCSYGCRGTGVLHSKFYLFDSRYGTPDHTVIVGSSNMTSNAVKVQANDLYGVSGQNGMYDDISATFDLMARSQRSAGPRYFGGGKYSGYFYPYRAATASSDLTMRALRTISCTGATGGAGIGGRTVLYINIHAWHGTRGRWLAERVKSMYNQGCYVRILYSFMGKGTYSYLKKGTGSRMILRRVLFSNARQRVAVKYSHQKMFAASGNIAGDSANWAVWTGSNNFTDRGIKADEITLRIADRGAFDQYAANWWFQRNQRSSNTWAIYEEPNGGGRAPD